MILFYEFSDKIYKSSIKDGNGSYPIFHRELIMTNNSLCKTISSFIDLADMLETYAGLDKDKFLSEDEFFAPLKENDILWSMAEENNMSESDMQAWIWSNITKKVKCSIIEEDGPAGGWPVVKVECLDKTFFFDWAE